MTTGTIQETRPKKGPDGLWYYGDVVQPADCFGIFWEAEAPDPDGTECRGCGFQEVCLDEFANGEFRRVEALSKDKSEEAIAEKMGMHIDAIRAARAHVNSKLPILQKKKRQPVTKDGGDVNPIMAGPSANYAAGPAIVVKQTLVKIVREPAGERTPFGEHTFMSRWERERKRSPKIAVVKVGETLTTIYKSDMYKVTCRKGFWLYNKIKYPTLYKVTEACVGKGSNWSGPKFWKLK